MLCHPLHRDPERGPPEPAGRRERGWVDAAVRTGDGEAGRLYFFGQHGFLRFPRVLPRQVVRRRPASANAGLGDRL